MQREKAHGKNIKLVTEKLYVNDVEYKLSAQEKWQSQNPQAANYTQVPSLPKAWAQYSQQPATGYHTRYPVLPQWENIGTSELTTPVDAAYARKYAAYAPAPQHLPQQTLRIPEPARHMPQPMQHMPLPMQHMP